MPLDNNMQILQEFLNQSLIDVKNLKLYHIVLELKKEDSAFLYFQLESNDGLAFYSTLPFTPHDQTRLIDIKGDVRLLESLIKVLKGYLEHRQFFIRTIETI